jgi:hypothetical protein
LPTIKTWERKKLYGMKIIISDHYRRFLFIVGVVEVVKVVLKLLKPGKERSFK